MLPEQGYRYNYGNKYRNNKKEGGLSGGPGQGGVGGGTQVQQALRGDDEAVADWSGRNGCGGGKGCCHD